MKRGRFTNAMATTALRNKNKPDLRKVLRTAFTTRYRYFDTAERRKFVRRRRGAAAIVNMLRRGTTFPGIAKKKSSRYYGAFKRRRPSVANFAIAARLALSLVANDYDGGDGCRLSGWRT